MGEAGLCAVFPTGITKPLTVFIITVLLAVGSKVMLPGVTEVDIVVLLKVKLPMLLFAAIASA